MSIKVNRYPSKEGGNFESHRRYIMNIPVPNRGFTDLGNSYVVYRTEPIITDTQSNNLVYPMVFADRTHFAGTSDRNYTLTTAQALIRNSKVTYDRAPGLRNETQQQNVLSQNLDWYKNSRGYQDAACVLSAGNSYNYGTLGNSGLPDSPFIQYSRPSALPAAGGTTSLSVPSQMRNVDCRIPMRHVDQFADGMHQFPMSVFGDTNYCIQLENVIKVVAPAQMPQNIACNALTTAVTGLVGDLNNPLVLTDNYLTNSRLNDIPLYVSAPINLTFTTAGVGGTVWGASRTVNTMLLTAGGTVKFLLDNPVDVGGTGVACTVVKYSFQGYQPASGTYQYPNTDNELVTGGTAATGTLWGLDADWNITNAYVELHELQLLPDQAKAAASALRNLEIPYFETVTVIKNMFDTAQYSDTIPYDPNCVGLYILTPQMNTLTSGFDQAYQYRHKVDSLDAQGRWVIVGPDQETNTSLPVGRQYHNYLLEAFFTNIGKRLLKYDAPSTNYTVYNDTCTHAFLPLIINGKPQGGIVSVDIQSRNNMQAKQVFWNLLNKRAVKVRDGQFVGVV